MVGWKGFYVGIQKPRVLRVLSSSSGVITYDFVGFGVTGSGCMSGGAPQVSCTALQQTSGVAGGK